MTKLLAILSLVIVVLLSLAACGGESMPTRAPSPDSTSAAIAAATSPTAPYTFPPSVTNQALSSLTDVPEVVLAGMTAEEIGALVSEAVPSTQRTGHLPNGTSISALVSTRVASLRFGRYGTLMPMFVQW